MTALTGERNTLFRDGSMLTLPVAAAKKLWAGGLAMRDASGNATPGATATGCLGIGRVEETADNAAGQAGDKSVTVRFGVFRWANSGSTDAIGLADIGNDCYVVDDQTVAKTSGTNTRSVAGKVVDVDALGVWVRSGV